MADHRDFLERMQELNPSAAYPTGMEACIVGIGRRAAEPPLFVVSTARCIEHYMTADGMSREDALEFFEYNCVSAFVGEGTPIFLEDC